MRNSDSVPDLKAKRTQVGILAEILELCRKPTAKTRIMYKTNMSHPGVQKFIKQLQKLELLRLEGHAAKYVTTEKGLEFIKRYAALRDLLK